MGQDDDGDESLWERYTADINKIEPANIVRHDTPDHSGIQTTTSKYEDKEHNNEVFYHVLEEFALDLKPMSAQLDDGNAMPAQIDKRTALRLKRGQMPVDARIDLHGLYQSDAKARLLAFIAASFQRGDRCILVITGKGQLVFEGETPKSNTPGVIKRNFKSWLAEEPYASMILKIEKARMRDGGEGAYYILLRRRR